MNVQPPAGTLALIIGKMESFAPFPTDAALCLQLDNLQANGCSCTHAYALHVLCR